MEAHAKTKSLELLNSSAGLYSLPDVYYRLRSVLDNPDYSMADVVTVISTDAGMTARLLKLVNSAYYGFESEIYSVSNAIGMIGTQQLQDLVLATSVTRTFAGISSDLMNMDNFWYNSICCGVADGVTELQDLQIGPEIWDLIGLSPSAYNSLCEDVETQVGEISNVIFPGSANTRTNTR